MIVQKVEHVLSNKVAEGSSSKQDDVVDTSHRRTFDDRFHRTETGIRAWDHILFVFSQEKVSLHKDDFEIFIVISTVRLIAKIRPFQEPHIRPTSMIMIFKLQETYDEGCVGTLIFDHVRERCSHNFELVIRFKIRLKFI